MAGLALRGHEPRPRGRRDRPGNRRPWRRPVRDGELALGGRCPTRDFYGAPTLAARLGAAALTGPMISQACATSVACLADAAAPVDAGVDGPCSSSPPTARATAPISSTRSPMRRERRRWPRTGCWTTSAETLGRRVDGRHRRGGRSRSRPDPRRDRRDDAAPLRAAPAALADDRARQRSSWFPPASRRPEPVLVEADSGVHETPARRSSPNSSPLARAAS